MILKKVFSRKKKKKKAELYVDIHSHLIPSIDDGASNIEESISLIKRLKDFGYKKLIITPHTDLEVYKNKKDNILNSFYVLRDTIKYKNIDIELDVSSEYYLDTGFIELLKSKEVLPILDKYILFETSYINRPEIILNDVVYEIKLMGYTPILAHPERYRYIRDSLKEYNILKKMGVLFQVNLNSFGGYYGKNAKEKALFLAKNGWIDFLGSDTHKMKHLDSLEKVLRNRSLMQFIFSNNRILNNHLL